MRIAPPITLSPEPVVLADAGVENVNAQVDDLIAAGVLRRVLAFTELKFSNSMIEAWWRSLKHQWLFLRRVEPGRAHRKAKSDHVRPFGLQHGCLFPPSATFPRSPLRSRTVGFPESGSDLG